VNNQALWTAVFTAIGVLGLWVAYRYGQLRRDARYKRALKGRVATSQFEPGRSGKKYPFYRRRYLASEIESRFYSALLDAVGYQYDIMMKVRVAGVIGCSQEDWRAGYGNTISSKEFDFVLLVPRTSSIVAAVELDDSTHDLPWRQERDVFLNEVCKEVGLPLVRIPVMPKYHHQGLRECIQVAVAGAGGRKQEVS